MRQELDRLQREEYGHVNNIKQTSPPSYTTRPWYNLVCGYEEKATTASTSFTPEEIIYAVSNQLGLTEHRNILIKLQRVDVWAMPDGKKRPVAGLDVTSVLAPKAAATPDSEGLFPMTLESITDKSLDVHGTAKVSYSWPKKMADYPYDATCRTRVVVASGNLDQIQIVRFHLLWTTYGGEGTKPGLRLLYPLEEGEEAAQQWHPTLREQPSFEDPDAEGFEN